MSGSRVLVRSWLRDLRNWVRPQPCGRNDLKRSCVIVLNEAFASIHHRERNRRYASCESDNCRVVSNMPSSVRFVAFLPAHHLCHRFNEPFSMFSWIAAKFGFCAIHNLAPSHPQSGKQQLRKSCSVLPCLSTSSPQCVQVSPGSCSLACWQCPPSSFTLIVRSPSFAVVSDTRPLRLPLPAMPLA